jgi:WD40 repeat protein
MPAAELSAVLSALQAGHLDQVLGASGPAPLLAAVRRQAASLRPPLPSGDPGYLLRQLCLQAREFGADDLATELRNRLLALPHPGLVPEWTTRRVSSAVVAEFAVTDSWITALAALPDGRVAYADYSGRLQVLDLAAPDAGPRPLGDHPRASALAALPGGRVVSAGEGPLRIWDPAVPGAAAVSLAGSENATSVAALPDGRIVSSALYALVWDPRAPDAGPVAVADHDGPVMVVDALPDGRVVYAGGGVGRVRVWDPAAAGGYGLVELPGHTGWVKAVAALPDGRVVSAGDDKRVLLWDPAAPGRPPVELGTHPWVSGLAALPNGRVLSYGGGLLRVWDCTRPEHPAAEIAGPDGSASVVAVLPGSKMVTSADGQVRIWDLTAVDRAQVTSASLGEQAADTWAAAVWPDGRVALGGPGERLRVLGPAAPASGTAEAAARAALGESVQVWALATLPEGGVAGGCSDGALRLWNPAMPGGSALTFRDESGSAPAAPAGQNPVLARMLRPDATVLAVAAMPGGRIAAGTVDGRVLVWSPAVPGAGTVLLGRHDGPVRAVAVLPGDRVASAADDGVVRVWNPSGPAAGFGGPDRSVRQVAALPDGRLVTGATDGRVQVVESGTGRVLTELGQHDRSVVAVAALPDGRVVSADERQVRLWDVATAVEAARVSCPVRMLAVAASSRSSPESAAGHWLVIVHPVQGVSLWSVAAAG